MSMKLGADILSAIPKLSIHFQSRLIRGLFVSSVYLNPTYFLDPDPIFKSFLEAEFQSL